MGKKSKYDVFKKGFTTDLKAFEGYLQKREYSRHTIGQFIAYVAYFLYWKKKVKLEVVSYDDLLVFIDYCKDDGDSIRLISRKLLSVRRYYDYLQSKDKANTNPADGLYLKGVKKKVPEHLLDKKELKSLYDSYQCYDLRSRRNKVILSLLIHQGVTIGELTRLEIDHIKLSSAKIEIPGSKRSNRRELELKADQILLLYEYLNEIRPKILKANSTKIDDQLIVSMTGSKDLKNTVHHFIKSLKKINENVINCGQIRQSVIAEWLKTEDVRYVQYKAGHRYVSATERYQTNYLKDLQMELDKHHPLG